MMEQNILISKQIRAESKLNKWRPKNVILVSVSRYKELSFTLALLVGIFLVASTGQLQQQNQPSDTSDSVNNINTDVKVVVSKAVLPPTEQRPNAAIDIRLGALIMSERIRLVSSRTNCLRDISNYYDENSEHESREPHKLRQKVLREIDTLLKQHRAAVNEIVSEAERFAASHTFQKNLRFNYTDVHRLRNELEWSKQIQIWTNELKNNSASMNGSLSEIIASLGATWGISGGAGVGERGGNQQPTSINGGAPVAGPPEWQTPIRNVVLQVNKNFGDIPVNTSMSAVHLPLPIYPGLPEIMNTIAWTENLDSVFKRNFAKYAHVHHQYYGDILGPLRTFPAHKWRIPRLEPDLFDARTRPWYSAGVAAPKDMIILVDSSGSMTGLRREIAKGVVFEILDTLTNEDNFLVLRFSETVTPVGLPKCQVRKPDLTPDLIQNCIIQKAPTVPRSKCNAFYSQINSQGQYLRDHPDLKPGINATVITDDAYYNSIANITNDIRDAYLLPATSRNIRYLKANFSMPTAGIANFTNALMSAFEIMNAYNRTRNLGSQCNKAIMLITDGAIRSHEEVFNRYNYPHSPVRVFTYMIGREVGDIKPTKAMACNNRGYYTNVINLSEIREQILKYLPVFARPAVLAHHHPISWTNAYGDETYQVLTDWVLETKRRERARIMLNEERERIALEANSSDTTTTVEDTGIPEYDELPAVMDELKKRIICEEQEDSEEIDASLKSELDPFGYNEPACHWSHLRRAELLTSVVKPVYDFRNTSIAFQRVLTQKMVLNDQEVHLRDARLLGVGAVDLKIDDMLRLAPSHQLGPNAYVILVGQNGFLLHHPDMRALLEDPFDRQSKLLKPYFNAVDLTHVEHVSNSSSEDQAKRLSQLRESIINRQIGEFTLNLKRTIDCRRRPHIRSQSFYFEPVQDTPFSLVLAFPFGYGHLKATARLNLNSESASQLPPLSNTSSATEWWTLHPSYRYCEGGPLRPMSNDTTMSIDYLLRNPHLWPAINYEDLTLLEKSEAKKDRSNQLVCDRDLFEYLLFDASATSSKFQGTCSNSDNEPYPESPECSRGWFGRSKIPNWCTKNRNDIIKSLENRGLELSFIATRSGLTRINIYDTALRVRKLAEVFMKKHNRAIDEPWYTKTVDFNVKHPDHVLVSVPFNAYNRLVAKLRQRITQRHRPVNETKTNCEILPEEEEGEQLGPADNQPPTNVDSQGSNPSIGQVKPSSLMEDSFSLDREQADDPSVESGTSSADSEPVDSSQHSIDYSTFSSLELLELVANSSVHISITQTIMSNRRAGIKKSVPVAVSGQLVDYVAFAKDFFEQVDLNIEIREPMSTESSNRIELCLGGSCPRKCGFRNDSIDCLLVDSNSFIVVGEELAHIGRSLAEYDDRLLASLIETKVFIPIRITDYQAICSRSDQQASEQQGRSMALAAAMTQSSSGDSTIWSNNWFAGLRLEIVSSVFSNMVSTLFMIGSAFYSLLVFQTADFQDLGQWMQLERSVVGAQLTANINQSMLALLPNKTYLRPCERTITVYEANTTKVRLERPEYYITRCGCSAWYVYEFVPKTNLIMLIVNTTSECRRNCSTDFGPIALAPIPGSPLPGDQQSIRDQMIAGQTNRSMEEQVCSMLEQADQMQSSTLRHYDLSSCITGHPDEAQIKICGAANQQAQLTLATLLVTLLLSCYWNLKWTGAISAI